MWSLGRIGTLSCQRASKVSTLGRTASPRSSTALIFAQPSIKRRNRENNSTGKICASCLVWSLQNLRTCGIMVNVFPPSLMVRISLLLSRSLPPGTSICRPDFVAPSSTNTFSKLRTKFGASILRFL